MISEKEVRHIARLARIKFSPAEEQEMVKQMQKILEYVDKLKTLDTSAVRPTVHAVEMATLLREDMTKPSLPFEEALQNAPEQEENCFTVPKVVDKQE